MHIGEVTESVDGSEDTIQASRGALRAKLLLLAEQTPATHATYREDVRTETRDALGNPVPPYQRLVGRCNLYFISPIIMLHKTEYERFSDELEYVGEVSGKHEHTAANTAELTFYRRNRWEADLCMLQATLMLKAKSMSATHAKLGEFRERVGLETCSVQVSFLLYRNKTKATPSTAT
ncbi:MAG: hypothetical protein WCV84_04295 [Patescibacteria group bacterium]